MSSQTGLIDYKFITCSAGYLENGVTRIVDQVVEQKMDYIKSKVEEILYEYVGIEKPIKKEKIEPLEVKTEGFLPTDLEQVSPDSDKKSSVSDSFNVADIKNEEIEEEIVEDEDFESPAFEPIESILLEKNENSRHSNLSAISGLTSQDSLEEKPEEPVEKMEIDQQNVEQQQDSQLSQISSIQDMSQEAAVESVPMPIEDDAQMPPLPAEKPEEPSKNEIEPEPEKSQFDLQKNSIEFTGNERPPAPLDDSTNSAENEKVLQPHDVPSNTMEIDNLYENDTTDSSEMRMEIDLKDETTQETPESSKIEESSQDSTISKEKPQSENKKDSHHTHRHKSDRSKDKHKPTSSHKSSHHRSSSSKTRHDDKTKSRNDGKSSSSSHKKSSSDKHRSSSSRKDHEKDKKSSRDESSRSKHHREHKDKPDDHYQEKSSSRRRRSTDHDSNDGKTVEKDKPSSSEKIENAEVKIGESSTNPGSSETKPVVVDQMSTENCETSIDPKSIATFAKKEQRSSILVKYDYLKSAQKPTESKQVGEDEEEEGFLGFPSEPLSVVNPWFECLRNEKNRKKKVNRQTSNNNYLKVEESLSLPLTKAKTKPKVKSLDSPSEASEKLLNGSEISKAESVTQQQRYDSNDLWKPRTDYGNRNRRRGQITEEVVPTVPTAVVEEVPMQIEEISAPVKITEPATENISN